MGLEPWRRWGPYVADRAWGTVREDYSSDGDAWNSFPHDHARSRAYRWNEDGLCGWSDDRQLLCLGLSFWNGRDPILKERLFGLNQHEGNHGEDVKEYWWFIDGTPTHSWNRWRYHYPRVEFPYRDLVEGNRRRTRRDPELDLLDTGVFDDGYWQIDVDIAKASPEDLRWRITIRNRSDVDDTLHVLPTMWFRNHWSWGRNEDRGGITRDDDALVAHHDELGEFRFSSDDAATVPLFCENETNHARLYGTEPITPYPKDGIGDHVVSGAATVNPDEVGTKAALWHEIVVRARAEHVIELRFCRVTEPAGNEDVFARRRAEADDFYEGVIGGGVDDEARAIARQAFGGLCWSKQWYHFDVGHWLDGDPVGPPPPSGRGDIRNGNWRHLRNADVVLMPDPWEYPWYASWDLAFHCIAFAHLDPCWAKEQLLLLSREWYMHPDGQLPAYEWNFDDVNPPVHAFAARRIFQIDGGADRHFLERVLHKQLLNFTWWVNRKDAEGDNLFEGGFLGLDNIGPFDRSMPVPGGGVLEQSDGTAWMARYCIDLLDLALILAAEDDVYEDLAVKFFAHYARIATAVETQGLWDDDDGFYHDQLRWPDGVRQRIESYSLVGLLPLSATAFLDSEAHGALQSLGGTIERMVRMRQVDADILANVWGAEGGALLSVVPPDRVRRVLWRMLAPDHFLSPHGIRSLSRWHRDHPLELQLGGTTTRLDYEPAESTTELFGGNSNWRGPVWFPMNYLLVAALRDLANGLGSGFTVECPVGSGDLLDLHAVADDLSDRLVSLFRRRPDGTRPCFGDDERFQHDPDWSEHLLFHEYFEGEDGRGLGASHQTGWTALVAVLVVERGATG